MNKNRSSVSYSVNAKVNFRIMIVGDSGVGKTSMIIRFVKGSFNARTPASVGIEFYSKNMDIGDEQVSLQLWDTVLVDVFRLDSRISSHLPNPFITKPAVS